MDVRFIRISGDSGRWRAFRISSFIEEPPTRYYGKIRVPAFEGEHGGGFVTVSLVIWSLREVWGDIPGPVEPFLILGVGLLAGGLLQWLLLRRRGIHATRWLVLWTLGMPLGMAVYLLVNTIIHFGLVVPGVLDTISWALDVTTIGFCIGGTAAAISGKALFRAISPDAPPPATSQLVGQR